MSCHKMKLLLPIFFMILLLLVLPQLFAEALIDATTSLDSLKNIQRENHNVADLNKIYRHPKINCNFACARRCREASRTNVCTRACGTCCERCQCVPPGTYGNKGACPCYASLKTHGLKPKCP